ncbi:MAG: 50S ribosomal protein L28 [Candidatus Harrisonbacteria bacterium]|nr:50S ribosomal protein L28 [Candidatus Harrisonbacteria bacterium]MBI3114395.1 50S ribosomal protein L28 [Candidatus Harrisonbacteria bacterium]
MRHCEICGKGSRMGGTRILLRGHYNPTNKTRKYPNLQKTRNAEGLRVLACTSCMRTMAKAGKAAA